MELFKVIGIMSGTSLDGVDLAFCEFKKNSSWIFNIRKCVTIPYSVEWKNTLKDLHLASASTYAQTHTAYGKYLGSLVADFIFQVRIVPDFISSHGHTIFHQPAAGFSSQLGDGAALAVTSKYPVVCDFRSCDIALGGQGAPLVPIGDQLLFSDYSNCLNLGGIANISFEKDGERIAFDICPCNIILNRLAAARGKEFDENGELARSGSVNENLLNKLNQLPFYHSQNPKSLGREDVDLHVLPILENASIPIEDQMATFCEHIVMQIASACKPGSVYITGGGAFNKFLIERLRLFSKVELILPDTTMIQFKEALIFAFLGLLRWKGEVNCLKSVTGAIRDSSGGAIYHP